MVEVKRSRLEAMSMECGVGHDGRNVEVAGVGGDGLTDKR